MAAEACAGVGPGSASCVGGGSTVYAPLGKACVRVGS